VSFLGVTHVAIAVPGELREAERFYCELFGLRVAWREPVPDGAPFDLDWAELDRAGVQPAIVMLHEGDFRLAITSSKDERPRGAIDHVGLQVTIETLRRIREQTEGYEVVTGRGDELFDFIDPFGIEWELDTRSHMDPIAIVQAKRERERAGNA
jgi:catechol 2,3-dioxygenase-like lactoylglutathione lyase family enzyme